MEYPKSAMRLTKQSLRKLKDNGFRFVLIKGYTIDRRMDYIDLKYFTLTPVKDLSDDPNKKGIYEPIDSPLLTEWASCPDQGANVIIEATLPAV
jgi:hypothetical protein